MEQELAENTAGVRKEEEQHQEPATVVEKREISALENIFVALHASMMRSFRAEDFRSANRLARQLLERYDTPSLIRGRCHLILSTAGGDYVWHAKEAVRILTELQKQFPELDKGHLRSAQNALKKAYEDEKAKANGDVDFLTDDEEALTESDDEKALTQSNLTGKSLAVDETSGSSPKRDVSGTTKNPVDKQSEAASLPRLAKKRFKTYEAHYPNGLFGDRSTSRERAAADDVPPINEQMRPANTEQKV